MAIALLAAPSNLGLRPPQPTSVPGCSKAPDALREAGLHTRLVERGAVDAGVVLPGRYVDDAVPGKSQVRNQQALVDHARRLADRVDTVLSQGHAPLVLGGDCSILVGAGLALARRGRYGLVHLDGHTDFRHPGNSDSCASLAGEDLAAAIGMHWPAVADVDGHGPYFRATDTVHIGCRSDDDDLPEVTDALGAVVTAAEARTSGMHTVASRARHVVTASGTNGYWLHLDVDVLDPSYLQAVDSPADGGLSPDELIDLLRLLAPAASGAQVTVFDPDLDPDGSQARLLARILSAGLQALGDATVGGRPDRTGVEGHRGDAVVS